MNTCHYTLSIITSISVAVRWGDGWFFLLFWVRDLDTIQFVPATIHGPIPVVARSKTWVSGGGHGCLSLVSVVCCQIEASVCSWSVVQRSPTGCSVSECDREDSIMRNPRPVELLRNKKDSYPVLIVCTCMSTVGRSWVLSYNESLNTKIREQLQHLGTIELINNRDSWCAPAVRSILNKSLLLQVVSSTLAINIFNYFRWKTPCWETR